MKHWQPCCGPQLSPCQPLLLSPHRPLNSPLPSPPLRRRRPPSNLPSNLPSRPRRPRNSPLPNSRSTQFNATVLNQINGPAGAILKAPGPDGVPPIRALMMRYTGGQGGAGNIPQEQYGNFLRELTALAAAGGGAA